MNVYTKFRPKMEVLEGTYCYIRALASALYKLPKERVSCINLFLFLLIFNPEKQQKPFQRKFSSRLFIKQKFEKKFFARSIKTSPSVPYCTDLFTFWSRERWQIIIWMYTYSYFMTRRTRQQPAVFILSNIALSGFYSNSK